MSPSPIPRRTFLQATAATAGLAALGSIKVRAANKSTLGPVTVGSGEHTYECLHDWAILPKTIAFGNTHGVAVDRAGNVHIKHTVHASSSSPDAICVFDPNGTFIRSWGAAHKGGAHGLTLARESGGRDEFLFLANCQNGVVQKTTLSGDLVLDLPWPEDSGVYNSKAEYKPTNVAVVPAAPASASENWKRHAGNIFVADGYGKSWIHRYSAAGTYLSTFGGPGKERGQVSCPHGIAIDTRSAEPHIIVADRSNRRIQKFSLGGRHLGFVTSELRSPCHFDQRGQLLLVPDLEARVTLLNEMNELVAHLGDGANFALRDKPRDQFIPGKFIAPHSACFDKDGNIFVVEWVEVGRVTKLRKVG
jgi:hypothetical protein